jgi:flagellar biosynthesis/type III secretory pathway protein FliH
MPASSTLLRTPGFLVASRAQAKVEEARFRGSPSDLSAAVWGGVPAPVPAPEPSSPVLVVFPPIEAATSIGALERKLAETASRVELAVERLRAVGERLAAEARADAFEIALTAARRLVEAELTVNPEAQLGFIRSAVRRLGEARTITVRLAPQQATAFESTAAGAALKAAPSSARLDIVADATLAPGDCVVDGDLASIDGRLETRFAEIRRSIIAAIGEDGA